MKYKKNHICFALLLCITAVCTLSGCQLAREDAGASENGNKLIGVFVTTEDIDLALFDAKGRRYAAHVPSKPAGKAGAARMNAAEPADEQAPKDDYIFEGIDGFGCFLVTNHTPEGESFTKTCTGSERFSDNIIHDMQLSVNSSAEGELTSIEGTVYITPPGREVVYDFNPVYQSADGRVYLTGGEGMSLVSELDQEGISMFHTKDESFTVTENGETRTGRFSMKISLRVMFSPEKIVLLQMDEHSRLLERTQYAPGTLPESLVPNEKAAYLIIETQKRNTKNQLLHTREIYDSEDIGMGTFYEQAKGICVKQWTQILWFE